MEDRSGRSGIPTVSAREMPFQHSRTNNNHFRSGLQMTAYDRVTPIESREHRERPAPPIQRLAPPPLAPYVPPEKRFFAPFYGDYREAQLSSDLRGKAHPSIPPPQRPAPSYIPQPPSQTSRPPSPPSSRGTDPSRPIVPYRTGQGYFMSRAEDMSRSQSHSSGQSNFSAPSGHVSRRPSSGSGREDENRNQRPHAASEPAPGGPQTLQPPRRSRVLMTNMQQQRLAGLWRTTKFPTTQEREDIAAEIGLTPRQVQVWFQNRRQNHRKHIASDTVPANADPRDYEDLQQSPRSRRMSFEQSGDEPVSQWNTTSSSTSMSSRSMPTTVFGGPLPPMALGGSIQQPRGYTSSSTSSRPPMFHSPFSPIKRKLEPESTLPRAQRISWQSSSSAGPSSSFDYAQSSSSSSGISASYDSYPSTLSLPLTGGSSRIPRPLAPSPRRVVSMGGMRDTPRPISPAMPRPSHLPPTLAALAVTRPVDPPDRELLSNTLPRLDLSSAADTTRPAATRTHSSSSASGRPLPKFRDIFGDRRRDPR